MRAFHARDLDAPVGYGAVRVFGSLGRDLLNPDARGQPHEAARGYPLAIGLLAGRVAVWRHRALGRWPADRQGFHTAEPAPKKMAAIYKSSRSPAAAMRA